MDRLLNSSKMKTIEISWKPDRTSKVPIYSQIVEYVTAKIQKGDWVEGERLPSQRRLSELFGVNRSTIVTAMEELLSYGIVESMGAAGTRISGGSWSLRLAQPPDWNQYIKSGPFKANRPTIQMINRMEFEQGYIRIGTGELSPDLYPKELVRDILNKLPDRIHSLNYLGTLGLPELREELCTYLEREQGIRTSPDNILITSGSLQALQLISICMLKRGATVYTEAPTYLKSLQVFQSAGMNMAGLPMDEEGMRYGSLRGKDLKDSIVYTIPSFHNPTGQVMSLKRRINLLSFLSEKHIPLIEDDAYGALWIDEKPPASIKSLDEGGNVLYLGTLSKTMAPGLRIGWVVGPEAVVYRLGDVKMQTDYGSSSVSQWVATELLNNPEYSAYLKELREQLRFRRDLADQALREFFGDLKESGSAATWDIPGGGFYIWLRFAGKLPMDKIFYEALHRGVLFNPGNVYDYAENNAIRVSYAWAAPEELRQAIRILSEIIRKYI